MASTQSGQVVRIVSTLVGAGALLVALVLFLFGAVAFGDELDKTAETTGRLTEVRPFTQSDGTPSDSGSCQLVVTFEVDGLTYTAESNVGTPDNCRRQPGESVPVHYDPGDPSENTAGATTAQWIGLGLLVAAGVLVTVVVLALRWIYRRTAAPAVSLPVVGPAFTLPTPTAAGFYPTGDGQTERWFNGQSWDYDVTRPVERPGETEPPLSGTH